MRINIVCLGDSNTWGYDPRSYFGSRYPAEYRWPDILSEEMGWNVINMGYNGQEIPDKPVSLPENTDLLIIMLGTNDILRGTQAQKAAQNMQRFISSLSLNPERILLLAPPLLGQGQWVTGEDPIRQSGLLAKAYRKIALDIGVRLIDSAEWDVPLAYDGVHFSEEGHIVFAANLVRILNKNT